MKICKKCGANYEGGEKFCKVCGQPLEETEVSKQALNPIVPQKPKKSKIGIYILIVVLLGLLSCGAGVAVKAMQDKQQKEQERREEQEAKEEKNAEKTEEKEGEVTEKESADKETEEAEKTEEELAAEEARKAEEAEQAELLKKYEEQERAEAEAAAQMHPVLADDEVEGEVLRIRVIFTECIEKSNSGAYEKVAMEEGYNAWFENDQLKMINTTVDTTTSSYERILIYENGKLIFAYLKENGNESRLYYKDDNIFRWSYPETTQIQDNNFENPDFIQNGINGRDLGYELYELALDARG